MSSMNENTAKTKFGKTFAKLTKIKGFEWIVVGIATAIVLLIYFSSSSLFQSGSSTDNTTTISSASEYANEIESKLSKVLSSVRGAGTVSVMVSLETSTEIVVANSKEERTNNSSGSSSSSSTTIIETPVLIGDEPLILMEILPKIKGVIVVAQGADNIQVRLNLLQAVQALLEVDANSIEIFVGE